VAGVRHAAYVAAPGNLDPVPEGRNVDVRRPSADADAAGRVARAVVTRYSMGAAAPRLLRSATVLDG